MDENNITTLQVINLLMSAGLVTNREITEETIEIYVQALKDIEPEILKGAALSHITNSQFFPTVAELRAEALDLIERAEGVYTAEEAWGLVAQAILDIGSYGYPDHLDERTQEAIRNAGGWRALCMSEHVPSDRKRFVDAYNGTRARQRKERLMLPGVADVIKRLSGEGQRALQAPVEEK